MCSIEAMSLGKPVIGGKDSGGLPWVLDFGKAGILANVKDPNDIAHKILMLINDQTLYIDYSNKSLNRVKQVFTKDKVAKAYEETYLKIVNTY
jgi:glycosyltransferase involved in cell wall biosynthesis